MNSLLPWIEPLFAGIAIAVLIFQKQSKVAPAMLGFYLLILLLFRDYQLTSPGILSSHLLALPHIIASWAAKTLILYAAVTHLFNPSNPPRYLVKICTILQSLAILLGMFWAFDAPQWGNLWQWDGIETLSLCTFLALIAWKDADKNNIIPTIVALFTLVIQNLALYGFGMDMALSRHSYTQLPQSHIFWIAGQCLFFAAACEVAYKIHRSAHSRPDSANRSPVKTIAAHTACFVCAAISILICAGFNLDKTALAFIFGLLWLALTLKKSIFSWIKAALGPAFILMLVLLPTQTSIVHAKTAPDAQTTLVLAGIRAEPENGILHYTANIADNTQQFTLRFDADNNEIHANGHADVRNGLRMNRFWAVDYRASRGITLLIRDITYDKYCELLLILIFCASLCGLIPRKNEQNALNDAKKSQRQ